MQLSDLTKPIDQMTDDELRDFLAEIRRRQTVEKPATVKRETKARKKTVNKQEKVINDLFDQLTEEQLEQLLKDRGL